jgi:type IV secretion system protein VirB11
LPKEEHLVTIEDTPEIFSPLKSTTALISSETIKERSMKSYCKYAMRMRPDRIIIGELRGAEANPFLLAMNTGHRGLMSTIHANSAIDAISRVALLLSMYSESENIGHQVCLELVCKNLDEVIYMENARVKEHIKILGIDGRRPYFEQILNPTLMGLNRIAT